MVWMVPVMSKHYTNDDIGWSDRLLNGDGLGLVAPEVHCPFIQNLGRLFVMRCYFFVQDAGVITFPIIRQVVDKYYVEKK